jgi:hypothetical protein
VDEIFHLLIITHAQFVDTCSDKQNTLPFCLFESFLFRNVLYVLENKWICQLAIDTSMLYLFFMRQKAIALTLLFTS